MPALTGLTRRIALIQGASDALTDSLTNRPPRIPRGNGVLMQCAAFLSDPQASTLIDDWTGISSITMQVRKDGPTGEALFDLTVAIGVINTGLTWAQWEARTHQHFTIALTAAQTNQTIPAGKSSLPIYIAWQANRSSGDPVFLGFTLTEIFEDGIGSSGVPVTGDPTYLTAAESRAEFVSRAESNPVLHLTGLTGGGAGNLDGVATVGLSVPRLFTVVIGGQLRTYQLRAGTDPESSPIIIRPDDFDPVTNARIFVAQSIASISPISSGRPPLVHFSAENVITEQVGGDSRVRRIVDFGAARAGKDLICGANAADLAALVPAAYNGRPCVRSLGINGAHTFYASSEESAPLYLPAFSLYVVAKVDNENSDYYGTIAGVDAQGFYGGDFGVTWSGAMEGGRAWGGYSNGPFMGAGNSAWRGGDLYVYALRGVVRSPGDPVESFVEFRQCDLLETSTATSPNVDAAWMARFNAIAGANSDNRTALDLCEIMWFDVMHPSVVQDEIIAALATKWGALTEFPQEE